jgi:hypothetical protein
VFLGLQTQALPLAVWIFLSIAAGAITSLFITSLFKVANLFSRSSSNKSKKVAASPASASASYQHSTQRTNIYLPNNKSSLAATCLNPSDAADDWGSNPSSNDDWGFEEDTKKTRNDNFVDDVNSRSYEVGSEPKDNVNSRSYEVGSEPKDNVNSRSYEVSSEPKSSDAAGGSRGDHRTGSVYSYSYRESSNSGVGKTESVYDADYRVITPPYHQPDTVEDDDDWGFDDDDDVEDSDRNSDPKWR